MFTASIEIIRLLQVFAPQFTTPAFSKAIRLACGVILAPGRRTVASALRSIGLREDGTFGKYHRLLSRDRWSALGLSRRLFLLLVSEFLTAGQIVEVLVDETLERRRGKKLAYKGWFRDAVRSTQSTTVTPLGSAGYACVCL